MPLVNVLINSRAYTIACDDGEEEHLRELAQFFDKRVRELIESVGQVGDNRLMVMAGLLVADELAEALSQVEDLKEEVAALKAAAPKAHGAGASSAEERVADALEDAAKRIEKIAQRVMHS